VYPTEREDYTNNDLTLFYIKIEKMMLKGSVSGFAHSICMFVYCLLIALTNTNIHIKMSPKFNGSSDNSSSNTTSSIIAITGLNLALSYENAAVDRLEKRLSESITPEVKERLSVILSRLENNKKD
jgi:hypothetical protein